MTVYDDHPASCPNCSIGLHWDALCECAEPLCVRCHRVVHVEMARRLEGWGHAS